MSKERIKFEKKKDDWRSKIWVKYSKKKVGTKKPGKCHEMGEYIVSNEGRWIGKNNIFSIPLSEFCWETLMKVDILADGFC